MSYGGAPEAERLAAVYDLPDSKLERVLGISIDGKFYPATDDPEGVVVEWDSSGIARIKEPACDWCDDGDQPVDGIHLVPDPEGIEGTWRVPCPRGGAA